MKVLEVANVNYALAAGLKELSLHGQRSTSRAGDVWVVPYPVTTVYKQPWQKVLFLARRDANPFFHLIESAWMLAGQQEVAPLEVLVPRFRKFAEADGRVHGAYGHRWRHSFGMDQIDSVLRQLRDKPDSRQAVIAMWSPGDDLDAYVRDRPCNTHIYLRLRPEAYRLALDLTVCCRSNDIHWGAYGANAVHFAVLQEALAGALGALVGRLYQVSNNYHGYVDTIGPLLSNMDVGVMVDDRYDAWRQGGHLPSQEPEDFLSEVPRLWVAVDRILHAVSTKSALRLDQVGPEVDPRIQFDRYHMRSSYARTVLAAAMAYHAYRMDHRGTARAYLECMPYQDWKVACTEWMCRRWYK